MARTRKSFNEARRLEASGIPRRGDRSPELALMMARRLGLAEPVTFSHLAKPEPLTTVDLGNPDLPISHHKWAILETIQQNPVTICLAETGSGKSTQIPQYLLERGYEVILTQPRRLAAEMVSRRIGQEVASKLGPDGFELVGYQTAERGTITDQTRVQVVTDGLQLVKEFGLFANNESQDNSHRVVVIDEVHERNTNIDVLLAWAKKGLSEQSDTRIVITTAGINAERMARYFSVSGFIPPIIEIPGRSYPIERSEEPESDVVEQAVKYARRGDNVLVFLPGLTEIDQAMTATRKRLSGDKGNYEYLPLHGKMTPAEQRQVEVEYPHPKIVFATNVAETSITIPDVDTVIDAGLERRIEIDEEGIESLVVGPISQASSKQRAGRCGRTKPGTYVLTRLTKKVRHTPLINRPEYSTPEILRSNVDKTVLSIAGTGLDIKYLPLPDPLDGRVVKRAKDALRILGALDEDDIITERGRRMNQFPVRPIFSRMITYAEEQNYKVKVKLLLAAMTASMESGGLPDYSSANSRNAWRKLTTETSSDMLAQLDLYLRVSKIDDPRELSEHGLNPRSVAEARKLYQKLLRRMNIPFDTPPEFMNEEEKAMLRECIVAGMIDFVYERKGKDYQRTSARLGRVAVPREVSDRSVVRRAPNLIVATPYAIAPPPGKDLPERHIVQDITSTTAGELGKVAAGLCEWRPTTSGFVWRDGTPYIQSERMFRDTVPTGEYRNDSVSWSPELAIEIIEILRKQPGRHLRKLIELKKKSERLHNLSGTTTPIHTNQLTECLEYASGLKKKSMKNKPMNPQLLDESLAPYVERFTALLPTDDEIQALEARSPEYYEISAATTVSLEYREGKPHIARITDEIKQELRMYPGELRLPDGRDILIPHKVGRSRKYPTLQEFQRTVV